MQAPGVKDQLVDTLSKCGSTYVAVNSTVYTFMDVKKLSALGSMGTSALYISHLMEHRQPKPCPRRTENVVILVVLGFRYAVIWGYGSLRPRLEGVSKSPLRDLNNSMTDSVFQTVFIDTIFAIYNPLRLNF